MPIRTKTSKSATADYYDYMSSFYKFWFIKSDSSAMHYGFSESNSDSFNTTLKNTNRFLANKAKITNSDLVLDAGCGIGGSAVWLAENIGCNIVGITLSDVQVNKAQRLSSKRKVDDKTTFINMDYTKTSFENNTFDVVWAIESICYAKDKQKVIGEFYRILKPGGRLVIADGYLIHKPTTPYEIKSLNQFQDGFVIPPLVTTDHFSDSMKNAKFNNIKIWDTTKRAYSSSRRMYYLCQPTYLISKFLEKLHIVSPILSNNNLAGIAQYRCMKKGIWGYFVFVATK